MKNDNSRGGKWMIYLKENEVSILHKILLIQI